MFPVALRALCLALCAVSQAALAWTPRTRSPEPMPVIAPELIVPPWAHWTCWQSFAARPGFDECDSAALVLVEGLPRDQASVRIDCVHELRYLAARQIAGRSMLMSTLERSVHSHHTVVLNGGRGHLDVRADLALAPQRMVPVHYWDGRVNCRFVGHR